LLARALRQGVARHDLLGWQAEGWVEGGLSDVRHAAEALDALKALEAARDGRLLPSERVLRARAHLARGEPEQAAVAMTGIDDPLDPALRWRIALATAAAALSEGELERTADALADMPADHDPAGRADLKATVVRRVGTSLVAAAASDAAGEEAEPRLTGLVKIAALLDPESPLPRELLSRLLEITTRMQQSSGLIDLGTTLAEAFPDDARVQLEVGSLIWRRKGDVVWNRRLLPALRRGGALATDKGDRHMVYFRLFGVLDTLQQSAPLSGAEREEALGAAAIALDGETSDGARAQIYRRRAKFRFRIGDPDGAMRDSDAAIALNSRNPDSVVVRLDLLAKVSGYDDAYAASLLRLSELVEKTEDDMDALTRAWSMYRTSPGSAAPRAVYEQLLAAKPNGRPRAWVRLGLMRRANGEHSLAKEAFAAALERLAGVERRAHFARTLATLLEMLETGTDEVTNQINRVAALVWSSGT
jgi:tetratricopeptide (TPR) repeat protein